MIEISENDENRAIAFKNRPEIREQAWNNSLPEAKRSREQNTAWLMVAFSRHETESHLALIREMEMVLGAIIRDLPERRYWLCPDLERHAKDVLAKAAEVLK